jgi:SAM-dependent methyltransferase
MMHGHTDFFDDTAFERIDEDDDAIFYLRPRLVNHIVSLASAHIGELYAERLQLGMRVLDLMSSYESHLPPSLTGIQLTGLGLNLEEMQANPALNQCVVHDLNHDPALPFADDSFDTIICTASVEYLTSPFDVMRELARVVKPGGNVMFTFADRWFPPKAIHLWGEVHAFERMAVVLAYFRDSGLFTDYYTETARGWPRPEDDKYAAELDDSDPVFFVSAKTVR